MRLRRPKLFGGSSGGEHQANFVLTANCITATYIAANAVEEAKIKAEAVSAAKAKVPAQPATPSGEAEVATANTGVPRKSLTVITGKAAQTKYKVKHLLNTTAIATVTAHKMTTKVITGPYLEAAGAGNYTWTVLSATEIEVTFGTELKAGEEAAIVTLG